MPDPAQLAKILAEEEVSHLLCVPSLYAVVLGEIEPGWQLNAEGHLERVYPFKNFVQALEFANKAGAIAEKEGHHPDLHVAWGKCKVEIWTHKIKGLTESDFYMAAKMDRAFQSMGQASAQAQV